jgi:hypothetical protein
MAIRIDIPGIGPVEVDGAASEETLQRIAAALETSSKGLTKDQKEQAKATQLATKAVKDYSTGWVAAADNLTQSFKNLALTATSVAAKFISNYESIAANPIKAGQELLNTGIDLIADFGGGLASAVPVVGGFLKGVVDATAAIAKLANNMFADQLQKNVAALQIYAKSGISFSGGMQDMQNMATSAGLGLKEFSEVVSKNKIELNKLGLSGGEAAARLAGGMGAATTTIGKSGQNLRRELIKMGFMYEDQGEIFTAFMAQQQAAGKLRSMSDVEVAKGTREYATNLKVISDLTGQDAKKLLERANAEMLRGSLQNKLVGDQKTAFASASGLLTAKSKDAGAALTQYLSLGTIVDPSIAGNQAMADMVRAIGDQVKAGNKNITNYTQEQMALAVDKIGTSGADLAEAVDNSLVAGASGAGANMARVSNEFVQSMGSLTPDPDAAKKSAEANEDQANKANQLGDTTAKLYDATKAQQVLIESKLNPRLETYVGLLEKLNSATIAAINKAAGGGGGAGLGGSKMTEEEALQNFIKGGGKKGGQYFYNGFLKTYAKGGKIGAGDAGIVGEAGPEMVVGPGTVINAAQLRENMAKLFEEQAKMLTTAKNPFQTALDDVDWKPVEGYGAIPYDKVTGTILDPTFVQDLSNKSKGWRDSVGMLSEKFGKDAGAVKKSDMLEGMDQEFLSSSNKQVLELLQQTKDAATQQTLHMADMLKQMGISTSHMAKIAVNTN